MKSVAICDRKRSVEYLQEDLLFEMLPELYQKHLKSQLSTAGFIFIKILPNLRKSIKKVNLEKLANALHLAI